MLNLVSLLVACVLGGMFGYFALLFIKDMLGL